MAAVFQHTGLVLLYLLLFVINLFVFTGLPGGWVMFAGILIFAFVSGISSTGWGYLVIIAILLIAGEVIESTMGLVITAQKGATRWGVLGAFLGGIAGAIGGAAIIPVAGSVLFGLLGAFAGAVICEYIYYNSLEQALRTGFFAFIGRLLALFVKFALGLVALGLFIYKSWS